MAKVGFLRRQCIVRADITLHCGAAGLGLTCKLVVSREISMQRLRHWTAQSEFRASNLFHVFGLQNNESSVVYFRGSSDGRRYKNSIVFLYKEQI